MTLQERILEALGEKALQRNVLYGKLKGESPSLVDSALGVLLKSGVVTFELGHYQRGSGKLPAPKEPMPQRRNGQPAKPDGKIAARRAADPLTRRQRQIFELAETGLAHAEIAVRLGISPGGVKSQLSGARQRLAALRGQLPERKSESAPSAAVQLSAEPSPSRGAEGSGPATGGADLLVADGNVTSAHVEESIATGRQIVVPIPLPTRRRTFSPDLIARLVEMQRSRAMLLQVLCDKVTICRQELADIEALVRIATAKEPA